MASANKFWWINRSVFKNKNSDLIKAVNCSNYWEPTTCQALCKALLGSKSKKTPAFQEPPDQWERHTSQWLEVSALMREDTGTPGKQKGSLTKPWGQESLPSSQEALSPLLLCEDTGNGSSPDTKHRICWHLDLGLPSLQNCEKQMFVV